jgi:single-strand DNA-binding protein
MFVSPLRRFVINSINLVARLTRDPELRDAAGTPVCNLRVAYNTRKKIDGEWQEVGNFINVTVFGKQAESVAQYLSKGREAAFTGRLEIRQYEHEGQKRESAEIIADSVTFIGGGNAGSADSVSGEFAADDSDLPF